MPVIGWIILALAGLMLLGRIARHLSYWAWVRSRKDPKERMEAELLWRNWRRSARRK